MPLAARLCPVAASESSHGRTGPDPLFFPKYISSRLFGYRTPLDAVSSGQGIFL